MVSQIDGQMAMRAPNKKKKEEEKLHLKSNKIINITLANLLLHRLHTQSVQQNIQYLQHNIQMKYVCKISS